MQDAVQDDLAGIWRRAREELQASLPASSFDFWLKHLRAVAVRRSTLYLTAPDGPRRWIEKRYAGVIRAAVRRQGDGLEEVGFLPIASADPPLPNPCRGAAEVSLNPDYTFERFVIGPGNRLAHAAALAVAESPGEAYNPLFLHGPPGLGKTHLLVAIANYLHRTSPQLAVRYTTAECFTNQFVAALRATGVEAFKDRHREIDVLLIDDVQFLEGKQRTEEEFFHTFNALHAAGSQVVLSSDRLPAQLEALAERLRDRFEWGLVAPLQAPDAATRLTVLGRLAREGGIILPDPQALPAIAQRALTNMRQLEGALTRVLAHSSLMDKPVTAELVNRVFPPSRPALVEVAFDQAPLAAIQAAISAEFGVSAEQLVGPSRIGRVVAARHIAIHLCRELTDVSLPRIGVAFGGRDHSTVLNAIRRAKVRMDADAELRARVHRIADRFPTATPVSAC